MTEINPIETNVDLPNEANSTNEISSGRHPLQWAGKHWRSLALSGGIMVGGILGANHIAENGLPDPKNVDITEVGRTFIDVAEEVSPYLLGLAGIQVASMALNRGGRRNLKMAYRGVGVSRTPYKTLMSGMLLPSIGVATLGTALMIEDGIHRGAGENISSMTKSLEEAHPGKEVVWTLQKGTNHFMNDSDLPPQIFQDISATEQVTNGSFMTAPFYRDLVTIPTPYSENQAGMIISVSGASPILPEVKDGAICEMVPEEKICDLKGDEIILDEGEGFNVGDNVEIRGHDFTVVGFPEEDQSLVNRLIAFTGVSEEMTNKDHYGYASLVENKEDAVKLMQDLGLNEEVDVLDTKEFLEANEDFWSHNGTPLLILLIGDIAVFAGVTFTSMKKFEQERDGPVLATLRAIGASKGQVAQQQYARNSIQISKGIVPGAAAAGVSTAAINSMLPGFAGTVTPKMIFASAGISLAVQAASVTKNVLSGRKVGLADQMKSS